MQGAGAASSAIGAYGSAQASKTSLNLQATLSDINAKSTMDMAEINRQQAEKVAQQTLLTGEREVQRSQIATTNLKSKQRVSMAANGIDLGEGSATQVLTSTDVMGEIDANTLQANAVRSAWGYRTQGEAEFNRSRVQASNQTSQGAMSRASAEAISPLGAGFTSLLGSAGTVASNWYQYNKGGESKTSNGRSWDEIKANLSSDPIASMNKSKGWTR